jgi:hypothetical protein
VAASLASRAASRASAAAFFAEYPLMSATTIAVIEAITVVIISGFIGHRSLFAVFLHLLDSPKLLSMFDQKDSLANLSFFSAHQSASSLSSSRFCVSAWVRLPCGSYGYVIAQL